MRVICAGRISDEDTRWRDARLQCSKAPEQWRCSPCRQDRYRAQSECVPRNTRINNAFCPTKEPPFVQSTRSPPSPSVSGKGRRVSPFISRINQGCRPYLDLDQHVVCRRQVIRASRIRRNRRESGGLETREMTARRNAMYAPLD